MMLRSGATRALSKYAVSSPIRFELANASVRNRLHSLARQSRVKIPLNLALSPYKPCLLALQRHASTVDPLSQKSEDKVGNTELEHHPEAVSADSSVRHVFREEGVEEQERDIDMLAGIKSDLRIIRDTFALQEVPREALVIGMAGVLPYLATSITTLYLSWDINYAAANGVGFLLSAETAELALHVVEPLQIGYGAVIISFLGAIHWGFEWSKYGGEHGYRRYATGVIAPALAWPTTLLPVEYALITQFLAFNWLYFTDARATVKGWCPHWYSTYRFVLTLIVGASIVLSLIARGEIADKVGRLPGPADRLKALRDSQMDSLEEEEREKRAKIFAKDEEEDDGDEDDE